MIICKIINVYVRNSRIYKMISDKRIGLVEDSREEFVKKEQAI